MAQRRYEAKDVRMELIDWGHDTVWVGGIEVPARFEVRLTHPEWPTPILLSVAVDPDQGPIAVGIRAKEPPASYRDVAAQLGSTAELDTVLAQAAALAAGVRAAVRMRQVMAPGSSWSAGLFDELAEHAKDVEVRAREAMRPQHRRRMTRKLLREVAEVYRAALAEGEAPTKAVSERFAVAHRTAGRWVSEARKVGELGPAVGPTAGEARGGDDGA